MANQNGLNAQTPAMYAGVNGASTIPAGHHSDMMELDRNMAALSSALSENRSEWAQLEDLLARASRIQGRILPRDGPSQLSNGVHSDDVDLDQPTVEQLQTELAATNAQLKDWQEQHEQIINEYQNTFGRVTEMIHKWRFDISVYLNKMQSHCTHQVNEARTETMEARLEYQEWQARLQQVSATVRAAMKTREEEGMPWKRRIAALKEENRMLRAKVGWDPPLDSDDEEEEEEQVEPRGRGVAEEVRGRLTQPGQVTVAVQEVPV